MSRQIFNKTINVDGIDIFYREAGDRENPSLLLLHGDLPAASVMFKNLMIALSDRFYLVAPDYPGFGFSAFPNRDHFEYSFGNIATDRKSTRLNSSHSQISYAVFCLKKKKKI